jgi:hypothetical protein
MPSLSKSGLPASAQIRPNSARTRCGERTRCWSTGERGNLRTVQFLLEHSKIESTVRYLGIEVDDAIEIAEKIDI